MMAEWPPGKRGQRCRPSLLQEMRHGCGWVQMGTPEGHWVPLGTTGYHMGPVMPQEIEATSLIWPRSASLAALLLASSPTA